MGPIAILTGASSGIGAAAAEQFVQRGFTVINISRRDCPVEGWRQSLQTCPMPIRPPKPAQHSPLACRQQAMFRSAWSTTRR